jgi:hypothetical protein
LPLTWTRFMPRHPSVWIRPRRNASGVSSTIRCCQSVSLILRRCFRPVPCCGKRHGHARQVDSTRMHAGPRLSRLGLGRRPPRISSIASQQLRTIPGYASSSATRRDQDVPERLMQPSPR